MVEFIAGVAVGVGGMIAKDKYLGNENSAKQQAQQREIDNLCNENEKFRKRNKDLERQVEDLLAENNKLRKQYKAKDKNPINQRLKHAPFYFSLFSPSLFSFFSHIFPSSE